jgi:hypothetical protein
VNDYEISEHLEIEWVTEHARKTYQGLHSECSGKFEQARLLTKDFTAISGEAIRTNSTILKVLRYCCAPSYSQMKLGQMVGLSSTSPFETRRLVSGARYAELHQVADQLADFIGDQLDKDRFPWLQKKLPTPLQESARDAAMRITCAVMADQNALTKLRNLRKQFQEDKIQATLVDAGLVEVEKRATIKAIDDVPEGHFSRECKVEVGGDRQKADFGIRTPDGGLLLLEAKAVGVRVDGFKRMKEVRDKASEWRSPKGPGPMVRVGAVIAGFLEPGQVNTLTKAGVSVYWEHRLEDLGRDVST